MEIFFIIRQFIFMENNLAEECQNNFFENPGSKIDEFES